MVGVPGKSKGCNTCRQRSIACSLERPQCIQCIKSNRVCSGYQRERIFISTQGNSGKSVALNPSRLGDSKKNRQSGNQRLRTIHQPSGWWEATTTTTFTAALPALASLPLEVTPINIYRQQILSAFLTCYIPFSHLGQAERKSWLMLLPSLPTMTQALETSIMALCASRLGRFYDDEALVHQSLKLYTRGLWELQRALWDPLLMYKDETVAACMALGMYELVECPAKTRLGYVSHHNGCERLIQLRGPERCTTGLAHHMFLAFRVQEIYQALEHHRPTYLTEHSWTTIPWKELSKQPFDRLLDLLVQAPELLRQADEFRELDVASRLSAELSLLDKLWQLDSDLKLFYDELEDATLGPLFWTQFAKDSVVVDGEEEELFSVTFQFLNLKMVGTLTLYWATLTLLWNGMCHLYGAVHLDANTLKNSREEFDHTGSPDEKSNFTFTPDLLRLPPLEHRTDFVSMARNVCRSVEYCLQDEMLSVGPSLVAAPLGMVVDVLRSYPAYGREVSWAITMLSRIQERGLRILKYIPGR